MHEHAAEAPQLFVALEQSAIAQMIRQSAWLYPIANVGHILALALFAGAATVMDLRILGAFSATTPSAIIVPARRAAMLGLGLMVFTGLMLFLPEAGRMAVHRVFLIKAALIAFGILNALLIAGPALRGLAGLPANASLPALARVAAVLSIATWLSVATCGRLIAYL